MTSLLQKVQMNVSHQFLNEVVSLPSTEAPHVVVEEEGEGLRGEPLPLGRTKHGRLCQRHNSEGGMDAVETFGQHFLI